jgi:hypothetical protein
LPLYDPSMVLRSTILISLPMLPTTLLTGVMPWSLLRLALPGSALRPWSLTVASLPICTRTGLEPDAFSELLLVGVLIA